MREDAPHWSDFEIGLVVADLAALGIEFAPACGSIEVHGGWAIIGSLLIEGPGRLKVRPREGLIQTQSDHLLAVASRVWLRGAGVITSWQQVPELGWVADVGMRYPSPFSSFACAISLEICEADVRNPLVVDGSRLPSS